MDSNNEIKFEDVLRTGFSEPLSDVGIEFTEIGIDHFINNDILKEIPIVKSIVGLYKITLTVKERFFIKKLLTFLNEFHSNKLTEKERSQFLYRFNTDPAYRDKVVTFLVTIIDQYFDAEQAKIKGNLFVAYIKGLLSWEDYKTTCFCLRNFNTIAIENLDELEQEKEPYHSQMRSVFDYGDSILLSSGLANVSSHHFFVNILGIIIHQYGIKCDYNNNLDELMKKSWIGSDHSIENGWGTFESEE